MKSKNQKWHKFFRTNINSFSFILWEKKKLGPTSESRQSPQFFIKIVKTDEKPTAKVAGIFKREQHTTREKCRKKKAFPQETKPFPQSYRTIRKAWHKNLGFLIHFTKFLIRTSTDQNTQNEEMEENTATNWNFVSTFKSRRKKTNSWKAKTKNDTNFSEKCLSSILWEKKVGSNFGR